MFSRAISSPHRYYRLNLHLKDLLTWDICARGVTPEGYFHTNEALCKKKKKAQELYKPKPIKTKFKYFPDTYDDVYYESLLKPEEFWAKAAENIHWDEKYSKILDDFNPPFNKWFVGGKMNTCYNAVDRHVAAGFGDQVAIIHDSPVTESISKITYAQLLEKVSLFADVLANNGVGYGDRVLIYMPMIPEAIVAMLASARLGAIHSLVFGGFASPQLATRINHAKPKVVVSANCAVEPGRVLHYKPLLDKAIEISDYKPPRCIIFNRQYKDFSPATLKSGLDLDWDDEMASARPRDYVPVLATDPLYILYTSGTTGLPKAVVRPCGGHAVVLNWSMTAQYGVLPHETWFSASDLGWIVGHSYIAYAPLLHCNTTVLYEGKPIGTPDASAFYRVLSQHDVVAMFVAPTAMRALRKEDPEGKYGENYSLSKFRCMFVAGEHCDPDTMKWIWNRFKTPTLDNWWQTETGSAITSTMVGLGNNLWPPWGMAGRSVPGWDVRILNRNGIDAEIGELGRIVAKLPLPPSCFSTLWDDDEKFKELYFSKYPGFYDTMDSGFFDVLGNVAVMARADDVINVAGHRLSSGQIEEAIVLHPLVTEAAVVPIPDDIKGHVPVGICVLKTDVESKTEDEIEEELVKLVRENVGPVAAFKRAIFVKRLPKTRSGKTARHTIAAMLAGREFKIPVTIEDEAVYPELQKTFNEKGIATNM